MEKKITGYISQIIGPVIDISFEKDDSDTIIQLPSIHDAVSIKRPDGSFAGNKKRSPESR